MMGFTRSNSISTAALFILPLIATGEVRAQALTYSGPLGSVSASVRTVGGSGESYQYTVSSAGQQITVNPTALTLSFDSFQILTAPLTISKQIQITAGFGQVKTYNLSLNFDAKVFSFNDGGAAHALSPTTGGKYEILNTGNLGYVTPVGGGSLTGTYSVTGPTETATGSFNVPINVFSYMIVPNTLNTSSYPDRLTLSHSNNIFHTFFNFAPGGSSSVDFIDATVDGAAIDWGLGEVYITGQFGDVTPGAMAIVPEPSTYAAIAGGFCLALVAYQRRFARTRAKPKSI